MAGTSSHKLLLGVAFAFIVFCVLASPISDFQRTRMFLFTPSWNLNVADRRIENIVYKRAIVGSSSSSRPPPFTGDWSSSRLNRRQYADVCTTESCQSFADSVMAARAANYTDIDPCTDFAEYTCSGWWTSHEFRTDQSSKLIVFHVRQLVKACMY
jgi:hypothetical protein